MVGCRGGGVEIQEKEYNYYSRTFQIKEEVSCNDFMNHKGSLVERIRGNECIYHPTAQGFGLRMLAYYRCISLIVSMIQDTI